MVNQETQLHGTKKEIDKKRIPIPEVKGWAHLGVRRIRAERAGRRKRTNQTRTRKNSPGRMKKRDNVLPRRGTKTGGTLPEKKSFNLQREGNAPKKKSQQPKKKSRTRRKKTGVKVPIQQWGGGVWRQGSMGKKGEPPPPGGGQARV